MNRTPLSRFLRAVRLRLWFEALLHQLRFAIWVSSGTLLLLALPYAAYGIPSPGTVLIVAVTLGSLALAPALLARASFSACAQHADRHFDGKSLLTTAQELDRIDDSQPAAETVLARATLKTSEWGRSLHTIWKLPDGISFLVAIIPVFIAALIFAGYTGQDDKQDLFGAKGDVAGSHDREADIFQGLSTLPELRQAIARDSMDNETLAQQEKAAQNDGLPVPGNTEPDANLDSPDTREADATSPGFASAAIDGGRSAGDARRGREDDQSSPEDPLPQYSTRQEIDVDRHGLSSAGRDESNREFFAQPEGSHVALSRITPAPAPPELSAWTTLTSAEIAYARRYLDAKGLPNE